MKSLSLTVLFIATVLFTYAQTTTLLDHPHIQVEGYAFEEVVPDEIYITITIFDDKDKSVETKQTELVKGLNDIGIVNKNITLLNEGANFGRLTWNRKEVVKSIELSVMASSADEVIKIFEKLDLLKVDDAFITKLDYSKREEIEKMVRIEAVSNAKSNGQDIVGAIGSKIGAPLKITKGYHINEIDDNRNYRGGYSGKSLYSVSYDKAAYFDGTFQKIRIEYTVDCWFKIE